MCNHHGQIMDSTVCLFTQTTTSGLKGGHAMALRLIVLNHFTQVILNLNLPVIPLLLDLTKCCH